MLKKSFLLVSTGILLTLSSCQNESELEIKTPENFCDCIELEATLLKQAYDKDFDEVKHEELREQFADELALCEDLQSEFETNLGQANPEDANDMRNEFMEECAAVSEYEDLLIATEKSSGAKLGINTLCDCIELQVDILNELGDDAFDEQVMLSIEQQYNKEFTACNAIQNEYQKENMGLNPQEAQQKQAEILSDCEAMEEFEKIQAELMQKMQELEGEGPNMDDIDEEELMRQLEEMEKN